MSQQRSIPTVALRQWRAPLTAFAAACLLAACGGGGGGRGPPAPPPPPPPPPPPRAGRDTGPSARSPTRAAS
ncbi:hypothetical protein I7825_35790, partial [Burkholderia cenocepacia]|nr:hypothetical protein [Burkholderia cenocepacia]